MLNNGNLVTVRHVFVDHDYLLVVVDTTIEYDLSNTTRKAKPFKLVVKNRIYNYKI